MFDETYEKAGRLTWYDPLLKATVLRLLPKTVRPNHVTLLRLAATPVVAMLMWYEIYYIGLIAFLLVAFTDAIDGSLARTKNQITAWGKIYDPLADKILVSSMVFIIVLRYIDYWTAIIIVSLEAVIIITAWRRKNQGAVIQANVWGKVKMNLQVLGVTILLIAIIFNWAALLPLASGTLYIAIAFAIVSLLTYGI